MSERPLAFFDTNLLLYCWSGDDRKAQRAEALLADQGTVSVQVLNEFANVAARKFKLPWGEIRDILSGLRSILTVQPLSVEIHEQALALVEQVSLCFYDALIVAAALDAGCDVLYSEDLQHGRLIGGRLTICNPFLVNQSEEGSPMEHGDPSAEPLARGAEGWSGLPQRPGRTAINSEYPGEPTTPKAKR